MPKARGGKKGRRGRGRQARRQRKVDVRKYEFFQKELDNIVSAFDAEGERNVQAAVSAYFDAYAKFQRTKWAEPKGESIKAFKKRFWNTFTGDLRTQLKIAGASGREYSEFLQRARLVIIAKRKG